MSTSTRWQFMFALCTGRKPAQQCTTRGHPLPFCQLTSGFVQYCRHVAADRHTHRRAWPVYISRHLRLTWNV